MSSNISISISLSNKNKVSQGLISELNNFSDITNIQINQSMSKGEAIIATLIRSLTIENIKKTPQAIMKLKNLLKNVFNSSKRYLLKSENVKIKLQYQTLTLTFENDSDKDIEQELEKLWKYLGKK